MLLVLQRMGSKVISVVFSPSSPGACAGKIIFTHYNNSKDQEESSQRKSVIVEIIIVFNLSFSSHRCS